jgi:hypothetical protein
LGVAWETDGVSDKALPRPPQATFCGGAILVSSALILLLAFDRTSSLGSIEAQEAAQRFADTQGSWIGLSADGWQTVLRVLCIVAAALSVVTGYLGWRVLQRDRSARLALSVLAPVALVAGYAVTALLPGVLAVSVLFLWRSPTREWFDGRVAPVRPRPSASQPEPVRAPDAPPPTQGTAIPAYAPPPTALPNPYRPEDRPEYRPEYRTERATGSPRPGSVTGAAVVTVVSSAIVLSVLTVVLLFVLGDRAGFEQEVSDELASQSAYGDVEASSVTGVLIGAIVVFLVWSVVAIVLALLTVRGSNVARITLVVSAIAAALVSLVAALAVFPLVVTVACIAVAVLLLRGEASAWFEARKTS